MHTNSESRSSNAPPRKPTSHPMVRSLSVPYVQRGPAGMFPPTSSGPGGVAGGGAPRAPIPNSFHMDLERWNFPLPADWEKENVGLGQEGEEEGKAGTRSGAVRPEGSSESQGPEEGWKGKESGSGKLQKGFGFGGDRGIWQTG